MIEDHSTGNSYFIFILIVPFPVASMYVHWTVQPVLVLCDLVTTQNLQVYQMVYICKSSLSLGVLIVFLSGFPMSLTRQRLSGRISVTLCLFSWRMDCGFLSSHMMMTVTRSSLIHTVFSCTIICMCIATCIMTSQMYCGSTSRVLV